MRADAAKKICAGKTITIVWEAGLAVLDPAQLLGRLWRGDRLQGQGGRGPTRKCFPKNMQDIARAPLV